MGISPRFLSAPTPECTLNTTCQQFDKPCRCVCDPCRILPVSESPKPPPERITMSLPLVNAAKQTVFVALGEGKAEIVQRVLEVGACC